MSHPSTTKTEKDNTYSPYSEYFKPMACLCVWWHGITLLYSTFCPKWVRLSVCLYSILLLSVFCISLAADQPVHDFGWFVGGGSRKQFPIHLAETKACFCARQVKTQTYSQLVRLTYSLPGVLLQEGWEEPQQKRAGMIPVETSLNWCYLTYHAMPVLHASHYHMALGTALWFVR